MVSNNFTALQEDSHPYVIDIELGKLKEPTAMKCSFPILFLSLPLFDSVSCSLYLSIFTPNRLLSSYEMKKKGEEPRKGTGTRAERGLPPFSFLFHPREMSLCSFPMNLRHLTSRTLFSSIIIVYARIIVKTVFEFFSLQVMSANEMEESLSSSSDFTHREETLDRSQPIMRSIAIRARTIKEEFNRAFG